MTPRKNVGEDAGLLRVRLRVQGKIIVLDSVCFVNGMSNFGECIAASGNHSHANFVNIYIYIKAIIVYKLMIRGHLCTHFGDIYMISRSLVDFLVLGNTTV